MSPDLDLDLPTKDKPKRQHLNLHLDTESKEAVNKLAKKWDMNKSATIRRLIEWLKEWVEEKQKKPNEDYFSFGSGRNDKFSVKTRQKEWLEKKSDRWDMSMSAIMRWTIKLRYSKEIDESSSNKKWIMYLIIIGSSMLLVILLMLVFDLQLIAAFLFSLIIVH
jgi:hypothetical protein